MPSLTPPPPHLVAKAKDLHQQAQAWLTVLDQAQSLAPGKAEALRSWSEDVADAHARRDGAAFSAHTWAGLDLLQALRQEVAGRLAQALGGDAFLEGLRSRRVLSADQAEVLLAQAQLFAADGVGALRRSLKGLRTRRGWAA